ncbi:TetR/AcrR family transcriptional regulator [Parashewanella tropica]|uniref:TetR/AcrR family transcriptional regulator n=1 Tax=Parashewanella tropica TaxID=2547970 RepID=UPI0010595718|nr:TetR/AcrR family transcriptional regulator [Parashewanella tropica]
MARPSLASTRREEILDALEHCIIEKGIQASSLEYIADTANMKRTILRHYIGNRDEIICALSSRWRDRYTEQWEQLLYWLPKKKRTEAMIDMLFSSRTKDYIKRTTITDALFTEAKRLEPVRADHKSTMLEGIKYITAILKEQFTEVSDDKIRLVASGIIANYIMSENLLTLGLTDEIYMLKESCLLLVSTLK